MSVVDPSRARAERLIGAGRLILGLSSLLALWLDPTEPIKQASTAYGLLVAYSIYALAGMALAWQRPALATRLGLVGHGFDLLFFTLFLYFTAGPSSPFFAFFVFSLVCGTLRWQWKGTVWTAGIALLALISVGVYFSEVRADPDFKLNMFIIRASYLGVIALLLSYLGAHEARGRKEIEELHLHLGSELARTAAMEERVRLARDLHDGVLQSMTAFALRVAATRRWLREDPQTARQSLEELQHLIASEQRDLRFFIDEVRPPRQGAPDGPTLVERLDDLATRIEREWGLEISLETGEVPDATDELSREIYHLVREALVNAARHAGASRARVHLGADGAEKISLIVEDDGVGFPFRGRLGQRELTASGQGPRSLLERVESLNGSLTIESKETGSCLEITLRS